jgi:hypothetical protein
MKKYILYIVVAFVVSVLLIPVVGNSVVQTRIQERITQLDDYGIETSKYKKTSSYLSTTQHFEFLLKDTKKFVNYLNKYSDKQIPSYIDALMDGMVVGVDMRYSNIPFSSSLLVEIYPTKLPTDIATQLQNEDIEFYNSLNKFFSNKGIFYSVEYNVLSDDFKGYLKDIDEKYIFKNNISMDIFLKNLTFKGKGSLIAPRRVSASFEKMSIDLNDNNEKLSFVLNKLSTSSNFESKTTYLRGLRFDNAHMLMDDISNKFEFDIKAFNFNASSITLDNTAELSSKVSVENFDFKLPNSDLRMKELNMDMGVSKLDKTMFEKFSKLLSISKADNSYNNIKELNKAFVELLSKGLEIDVADMSAKHIILKNKDLKSYKIVSNIVVYEDKELLAKVLKSPLYVLKNIDIDTKMQFAKPLYDELVKINRGISFLSKNAKIVDDKVFIDILYSKGQMTLNGKKLN